MLVHSGTEARDLQPFVVRDVYGMRKHDGWLHMGYADIAVLDIGYILEHAGEQVQVTCIHSNSVAVTRGFAGEVVEHGPGADWRIVNWPTYCVTPLPGVELRDCRTCGAPSQVVGEPCRYCKALQERRA